MLGAFSCFLCIVPFTFCYFLAMDYLVAGDWKIIAVVDKWGNCCFFHCCVSFFVSFNFLVSWNPDDCGVCFRCSSWMVDIRWFS